jgi:alpha-mannosidase
VNEVYKDAAADYAKVAEIGERLVDQSLREISEKVDTSAMEAPIALFQNSTMGSQGEIPWRGKSETPQSLAVDDERLPVQYVEEFGEKKVVFPTPNAALGSVAVGDLTEHAAPSRYRLKASPRKIENAELAVRFDAHGNITSVQSIEDGTEFIVPGKLANLFQLFEDKPLNWSAWDVDVFAFETGKDLVRSDSFEIVERGPVRVAAEVVRKFGSSRITQRISLGPTPGVRFDTEVDWHEEDKLLKVAFPVNINSARATYEIQFGHVERPTHMNTTWDMARFEVPAQKWADLSEGDQGVALINDCKYGYDVHGNVMRLSLLRAPKAPDPECDMGKHRFTYVLYPHFGPFNYGGVVQAAYAVNAPVRWAKLKPAEGLDGTLPPFVSVEDRNLVVETVKRSEDGKGLIVRLFECQNARGRAELSCARAPKEAWLCNLEEHPLQELEIEDSLVAIPYRPFEIITVKLRV